MIDALRGFIESVMSLHLATPTIRIGLSVEHYLAALRTMPFPNGEEKRDSFHMMGIEFYPIYESTSQSTTEDLFWTVIADVVKTQTDWSVTKHTRVELMTHRCIETIAYQTVIVECGQHSRTLRVAYHADCDTLYVQM